MWQLSSMSQASLSARQCGRCLQRAVMWPLSLACGDVAAVFTTSQRAAMWTLSSACRCLQVCDIRSQLASAHTATLRSAAARNGTLQYRRRRFAIASLVAGSATCRHAGLPYVGKSSICRHVGHMSARRPTSHTRCRSKRPL